MSKITLVRTPTKKKLFVVYLVVYNALMLLVVLVVTNKSRVAWHSYKLAWKKNTESRFFDD